MRYGRLIDAAQHRTTSHGIPTVGRRERREAERCDHPTALMGRASDVMYADLGENHDCWETDPYNKGCRPKGFRQPQLLRDRADQPSRKNGENSFDEHGLRSCPAP